MKPNPQFDPTNIVVSLPEGIVVTYLAAMGDDATKLERGRLHRTGCGHLRRGPRSERRRIEAAPTLAVLRAANPRPCAFCSPAIKLGEYTLDPVLVALDAARDAAEAQQLKRMSTEYDRVMGPGL